MHISSFAPSTGREIQDFSSQGVRLARLVNQARNVSVVCMHLEPSGVIGRRPAATNQLFLVVQGSGIVTGGDNQPMEVKAGCAVFWQACELHETRAQEVGLMAVVIEGEELDLESR